MEFIQVVKHYVVTVRDQTIENMKIGGFTESPSKSLEFLYPLENNSKYAVNTPCPLFFRLNR